MIDEALEKHIKTLYSSTPLYYANAQGNPEPYHTMIKVVDPERPVTLCDEQGDAGEALFQFTTYKGKTPTQVMKLAEELKNVVKGIKGNIGTSPDDYLIDDNITSGVRMIAEGAGSLMVWGVIFESTIVWHKI